MLDARIIISPDEAVLIRSGGKSASSIEAPRTATWRFKPSG
jgi:hypothetical protein